MELNLSKKRKSTRIYIRNFKGLNEKKRNTYGVTQDIKNEFEKIDPDENFLLAGNR